MSHITGTLQTVTPAISIGPGSGSASSGPNLWTHAFVPAAPPATTPPGGTKFVILHFTSAALAAGDRLEVDLGYDTDRFTSADGSDFWTRPANLNALPGGAVAIRYLAAAGSAGTVQLDRYGRGERHDGEYDHLALSNCDPFIPAPSYTEPIYDPGWLCHDPPQWQDAACVAVPDVRRRVASSVCMIVTVHGAAGHVSSCSGTLIGPDLVITAGHCLDNADDALSSSVTFDYQTECGGNKPPGYNARFYKVVRLVKRRYNDPAFPNSDYAFLQLRTPPAGIPVPVIPTRDSIPPAGEQVFTVHHPNGATKKLSPNGALVETVESSSAGGIRCHLDISGGSSGSGLFDLTGRIVGVLSAGAYRSDHVIEGAACWLSYYPTASIRLDVAATPLPSPNRDVMLVFDRSGSMWGDAGTGRSKIEEARDAASLFVQLVRNDAANRLGLVSFSTTPTSPVDFALTAANAAKVALVGPSPYTTGIVGGLTPGGSTTIGGGLDSARTALGMAGANRRTILLMTDGLENTPPMVAGIEPGLGGIDINVIGFGTESSLNGPLLAGLAESHGGLYARAGTGLHLKKFFALAFGDIFASGSLYDPDQTLPAADRVSKPTAFRVCGEESLTVVAGWDRPEAHLALRVRAPSGAQITAATPGVEHATGLTWTFLRIPLPLAGDGDGAWEAVLGRVRDGDKPFDAKDTTYFVNVIATGGPKLHRWMKGSRFYTGDEVNPVVLLRHSDGSVPDSAQVHVTVTRPAAAAGDVLSKSGLRSPRLADEDAAPARYATLMDLERESGRPAVDYAQETFELESGPGMVPGAFEEDGRFGRFLKDLLKVEGNYTFHARAVYGQGCTASRETTWSIHADVGVDAACTRVTSSVFATQRDGRKQVRIVFVPCDRYGNRLGPGRANDLILGGSAGSTLQGRIVDTGDGSYHATVLWDPASGSPPGFTLGQPGRSPVVIHDAGQTAHGGFNWWLLLLILLGAGLVVLLGLWLL